MTHITEPRVIDNHAAMGPSITTGHTDTAPDEMVGRPEQREAAAESIWDSEGGTVER